MNHYTIRLETGKDYRAVEELTREAVPLYQYLNTKNFVHNKDIS